MSFDNVDRDSLWIIMIHYGIRNKYVSVIKENYKGMMHRILQGVDISESFNVQTGVRQGFLLSIFLFHLAIDWVMRERDNKRRPGLCRLFGFTVTQPWQARIQDFSSGGVQLFRKFCQAKKKRGGGGEKTKVCCGSFPSVCRYMISIDFPDNYLHTDLFSFLFFGGGCLVQFQAPLYIKQTDTDDMIVFIL